MAALLCLIVAGVAIAISATSGNSKSNGGLPPNGDTSKLLTEDKYLFTELDTYELLSEQDAPSSSPADTMTVQFADYPCFSSTSSFDEAIQQAIIDENVAFMNKTVLLQQAASGSLKRHPFSDCQFDSTSVNYRAKRVTLRVGINTKLRGWRPLTYALPGDVVTITFPANFTGYADTAIAIGMADSSGGQSQNLPDPSKFSSQIMPIITQVFSYADYSAFLSADTLKIGSPLGGMVYLRTWDTAFSSYDPFYVTVTGGVRAPVYLVGQTSDAEWDDVLRNSAGLMAEIRAPNLRIMSTASYVRGVPGAKMRQGAELFYRALALSETATGGDGRNLPITMM
ncbi:MAG TPA: hypothetical protein V6C97_16185, partial [Oculatellaceae cyanobacterium]